MIDRARYLLAMDHKLLSAGLVALLEPEFECVGVITEGFKVMSSVEALNPEILFFHHGIQGPGGVAAASELKRHQLACRVVILGAPADPTWIRRASHAGVRGFLDHRSSNEELPRAFYEVLKGGVYISPSVGRALLIGEPVPSRENRDFKANANDGGKALSFSEDLTVRQSEIACLVAAGMRNKEIAADLGISAPTVRSHLVNIFDKLGVKNRVELALLVVGARSSRHDSSSAPDD